MNTNPQPHAYQRIVILDFDGVIADTLQDMLKFSDQVAAEFGIQHQTTLHDLEVLQPMSFANLGRQIGIPESQVNLYVERMVACFQNSPIPCPIIPGMAEAIRDMAGDSRLAIVSGNDTLVIQHFLQYYNLEPYIECIYGVDLPGSKKEKILTILQRFDSPSLPAFMVGDAASDVEAAHQAGILGVAVGWGHQSQEKLLAARPEIFVASPHLLAREIRNYPHQG